MALVACDKYWYDLTALQWINKSNQYSFGRGATSLPVGGLIKQALHRYESV